MAKNPLNNPTVPAEDVIRIKTSDPELTGNVADGTYYARVVSVSQSTSKAGNPMLVWTFSMWTKKLNGRDVKTMKTWTALTPNAVWKAIEVIQALGLSKPGQDTEFKPSEAVNRLCQLTILNETVAGVLRSSVVKVMPYSAVEIGKKWTPAALSPVVTPRAPVADDVPDDTDAAFGYPSDDEDESYETLPVVPDDESDEDDEE